MMKYQNKYRIDSNRLAGFNYSESYWYFITVCTWNKQNYFSHILRSTSVLTAYGDILEEEINNTVKLKKADIDMYVIMPNHFHMIIIPESGSHLGIIVGQIKSLTSKRIMKFNNNFRWQSNYYDHIIRNEEDLFRIRKYIELNPFKWELDEYYNK